MPRATAAKLLRSLVDPARPPTMGMPRNERDAVIAARNRHVLAYDNLSGLPTWFSDTLCRLSTGEGYATRALYTDDEEVVMEASRPVILTGIENPSVRGDLDGTVDHHQARPHCGRGLAARSLS